ncbi:MerC domain-containing protein [Shewanella waksmanii]|uniref:MerC domain-containing protein n=1 Tax=Shewanella waksmanii TaxID=213783 RepID=UPI00373519F3
MNTLRAVSDKFAIGLSTICAIHCLALPIMLTLVPSMTALPLGNELFHLWMVIVVVPISLYGLTVGCKQHRQGKVLAWGLAGLTCLVLAIALGEDAIGEFGEKAMTLLGAGMMVVGHWLNYRLCRQSQSQDCGCSE